MGLHHILQVWKSGQNSLALVDTENRDVPWPCLSEVLGFLEAGDRVHRYGDESVLVGNSRQKKDPL